MSSFVTWRSGTRRYQGKASVGLRVPDEGQIRITCRLQQVQQRVKFSIRATASTAALQRRYESHTSSTPHGHVVIGLVACHRFSLPNYRTDVFHGRFELPSSQ